MGTFLAGLITESKWDQGHLASQYHTTSGDLAFVARPNRLGHSSKTKGKGGEALGRIMIAAGKIKSWKHDGLYCECCKDGLKEWLWKMVQSGKRLSYAIAPFPLSFVATFFFFFKDLAAKHPKLFFANLIGMFGCEPCCSMCYRLNTLQQVSCLWAQAGHRECTSWARGSPDILLSGNSSELSTMQIH